MFSARSIKAVFTGSAPLSRATRRAADLLKPFSIAALVVLLAACGPLKPYRIDIRQGNYVTQEMLAQLSPGMTEEQVRFIMGSPLLIDPFHPDRWDYVYRFARAGEVSDTRKVTLLFKDGKLKSVEGDVVAAAPAQNPPRANP